MVGGVTIADLIQELPKAGEFAFELDELPGYQMILDGLQKVIVTLYAREKPKEPGKGFTYFETSVSRELIADAEAFGGFLREMVPNGVRWAGRLSAAAGRKDKWEFFG
jgi:hypothetical protein